MARAGELIEGFGMFPLGNPLLPGACFVLVIHDPEASDPHRAGAAA